MKAADILNAGIQHMNDRAATYDKPEGERSMEATVKAFNAMTGHNLTTEQGWLFQICLKGVRSQQGAYRADSYEDGAAYFGLMGEEAHKARANAWQPVAGTEPDTTPYHDEWPEDRMDIIGQNGNDGAVYEAAEAPTSDDQSTRYNCTTQGEIVDPVQNAGLSWLNSPEWATVILHHHALGYVFAEAHEAEACYVRADDPFGLRQFIDKNAVEIFKLIAKRGGVTV